MSRSKAPHFDTYGLLRATNSRIRFSTGIRESFAFSSAITAGWRIPLAFVLLMLLMMEILVPSPVYITGGFSDPAVKTDFAAWGVAAFALKTLVFQPWIHLALARAYNMLAGRPPLPVKP